MERAMTSQNDFPTAGVELRYLLVGSDYARSLAFYLVIAYAQLTASIYTGLLIPGRAV